MTVLAPFADVEAKLATDTMRLLANAVATIDGSEFPVMFDAAYQSVIEVDSVYPVASALDTDIEAAAVVENSILTIQKPTATVGTQYRVRRLEPDGNGMTLMRLAVEEA